MEIFGVVAVNCWAIASLNVVFLYNIIAGTKATADLPSSKSIQIIIYFKFNNYLNLPEGIFFLILCETRINCIPINASFAQYFGCQAISF